MIFVDRSAVRCPASLVDPDQAGDKELTKANIHFLSVPPATGTFKFRAYKGDDVKEALNSLFHYKCAYCEFKFGPGAPVDVEHFRPKREVAEDEAHPGYWWLASTWENLLPCCIDCNRKRNQKHHMDPGNPTRVTKFQSGKEATFPLSLGGHRANGPEKDLSLEDPILINPTEQDPRQHLAWPNDLGIVVAVQHSIGEDLKGKKSIEVYGLNRLQLVKERKSELQRLEFQVQVIQDLIEYSDPAKGPQVLAMVENHIETTKRQCSPGFSFSECKKQFLGRRLLELSTKVDRLRSPTQNS